jgi:hypothetical protein
MKKRILIAAILSLVTTAVLGDMYQDAKNAELPAARNNLELGTVKSEGGDPPDAITRFYTWDQHHPQFQINAQPDGNEYTVEQAGQTGSGSTRLCYSPSSADVDCNYAANGLGSHVFGNGAGTQLKLSHSGSAPVNGYIHVYSGGDAQASIFAESPVVYGVGLYLRAQGDAGITLSNGIGNLASFNSPGSPQNFFSFQTGTTGQPAVITTNAVSVQINGQRHPMATKTANYSVTPQDSGTHFDNIGATGTVIFTLPSAVRNNNFCFTVDAAFTLRIAAHDAADKIAIGGTNSLAGGNIQASAPFAGICIKSHRAGQWVTTSTPDKAQWTVN